MASRVAVPMVREESGGGGLSRCALLTTAGSILSSSVLYSTMEKNRSKRMVEEDKDSVKAHWLGTAHPGS